MITFRDGCHLVNIKKAKTFLRKRVKNLQLVEDLIGETFLVEIKANPTFNDERHLIRTFYVSLRNRLYSYVTVQNQKKRQLPAVVDYISYLCPNANCYAPQLINFEEIRSKIPKNQIPVLEAMLEELNSVEMSRCLGIKKATAKWQRNQIQKIAKKILQYEGKVANYTDKEI